MYCNSTYRVIYVENVIQEPYAEAYQQTGNNTDDCRTESIDYVTAGGDCNQTSQGCVQAHGDIWLAVLDPGEDHAGNSCQCRSNGRGEEDGAQLRNRCCSSAVESIPAEPQDEYAQGADGQRVTRDCVDFYLAVLGLGEFTDTGSEDRSTDQCGDTADHVDDTGTGEIVERCGKLRQPAAAPYPVCLDRIDDCRDHCGIDTIGNELCTFCHGTGNNRCRCCAEYQVEYETGPVKVCIVRENVETRLADDADQIFAAQQTETDQNEYHCAETKVHEVFHNNVAGVLRSGETSLNHCKTALHKEYQCRTDQEPYAVNVVVYQT